MNIHVHVALKHTCIQLHVHVHAIVYWCLIYCITTCMFTTCIYMHKIVCNRHICGLDGYVVTCTQIQKHKNTQTDTLYTQTHTIYYTDLLNVWSQNFVGMDMQHKDILVAHTNTQTHKYTFYIHTCIYVRTHKHTLYTHKYTHCIHTHSGD